MYTLFIYKSEITLHVEIIVKLFFVNYCGIIFSWISLTCLRLFNSILPFPIFIAGKYYVVLTYIFMISIRKRRKYYIHEYAHALKQFFFSKT